MRVSTARQRVIAYIAFVVAFALGAHYAAPEVGGGASAFVVMWTPALAALAASVLTRRSLGAIGWRPWPIKWLAAGWIIPSLYAFPAYALVWLAGLGNVPSPTFLERARFTLGMPSEANSLVIVSAFGYIALVNLLPNMFLTLGEELGWRGFLVPELTRWVGFRRASLYSGVIWGAWHLPGILTGAYGAAGTPKAYQLLCFTILVLATAVVQAWLRICSRSVWPSTIMHATHNGIIQAFFNRITADTGHTAWFIGEFGVALVPFTVAVAWYCWHHPPTSDGFRPGGVGGTEESQ
jgi:CAAX protease family protein